MVPSRISESGGRDVGENPIAPEMLLDPNMIYAKQILPKIAQLELKP